jgi:hypothetical protein
MQLSRAPHTGSVTSQRAIAIQRRLVPMAVGPDGTAVLRKQYQGRSA